MPELRIDPLSGLRVLVAGERRERPLPLSPAAGRTPIDLDTDPFLEGHERETPAELWALRPDGGAPDGPGWSVRAFPNRYPALGQEGAELVADPLAAGRGEPGLFAARPASGAHEVIVNSPAPVSSLLELDADALELALSSWRERMRAHAGAAYVHVFVNEGRTAGSSLPHTHAQLLALPFVPSAIARERERFTAYSNRTQGRNLLEDLLQEEVRRRERVVTIDAEAVVICPFASRLPFELQLVPRRTVRAFEDEGPLGARLLRDALARLEAALGGLPPLNLWVRTAPRDAERFCWRIEVLPRLAQPAGLELGAGVHLNELPPERAAALLRAASV